jgi:hypothetical protein
MPWALFADRRGAPVLRGYAVATADRAGQLGVTRRGAPLSLIDEVAWEPSRQAVRFKVPDYLTSVKDDAFYGWPYSYYGQPIDPRVDRF